MLMTRRAVQMGKPIETVALLDGNANGPLLRPRSWLLLALLPCMIVVGEGGSCSGA